MSAMFQKQIDDKDADKLLNVGFDPESKNRSDSFGMIDQHDDFSDDISRKGYDIVPMSQAVKRFPRLIDEYLWSVVKKDSDKYTEAVAAVDQSGYLILVKKGYQGVLPLQACFFMKEAKSEQKVHNLIVMEEDSRIDIINGCASSDHITEGMHIGVSEIYLKKGAYLSYTMIHDWSEGLEVRPRTGIIAEENATFISNYISIKKSKFTESNPFCILRGDNSKGVFNSLIYAPEGSYYDMGSRVYLEGRGSKSDIISRSISGGGTVIARGELVGRNVDIHAHLECSSMLLNEKGSVKAIPILEANHPNVDMSHEASIGKIAEEEIYYLMSRGISEEKAVSLIVRGFLDTKILGLPEFLEQEVDKTIAMVEEGGF